MADAASFTPTTSRSAQAVYLSRVVAAAMETPGVDLVVPMTFQRCGELDRGERDAGVLQLARLEIARVDSDPSLPENGQIEFDVQGGHERSAARSSRHVRLLRSRADDDTGDRQRAEPADARLPHRDARVNPSPDGYPHAAHLPPPSGPALAALRTRAQDDAAIALLDAWATVADVLTFYQERIANEGFLRTATERRSVLELARRSATSCSPASPRRRTGLHRGGRTGRSGHSEGRSRDAGPEHPRPDQAAAAFETSDDLVAKAGWNELRPRLARPQAARHSQATCIYPADSTRASPAGRMTAASP